jgi:hypothetical protein
MRGSIRPRPISPTRHMGIMRIKIRSLAFFALAKIDRTKATKKITGIMAIAPREYVRTTQAVDATKATAFKMDFRSPPIRKHAKNIPTKRCIPIARQF